MYKKIIHLNELDFVRERLPGRVVVTNGCFELLHLGHIKYLKEASELGVSLIVGVNSDSSIIQYKGRLRVPYDENYRAEMLAVLDFIDYVVIFDDESAAKFIEIAMPDIYVKGGDYSIETLNKDEKDVLDRCNASVKFIPFVKEFSTTKLIKDLIKLNYKSV